MKLAASITPRDTVEIDILVTSSRYIPDSIELRPISKRGRYLSRAYGLAEGDMLTIHIDEAERVFRIVDFLRLNTETRG